MAGYLTTAAWMGVRWMVGIEAVERRQRFLPLPILRLGPRLVVEYCELQYKCQHNVEFSIENAETVENPP